MSKIFFRKRTKDAKIPTKGSPGSAGLDLYLLGDAVIRPRQPNILSTGISVVIPDGYVGIVKPRSGLAIDEGIDVMAGVIDSDYRGELKVVISCCGHYDILLDHGARIAQLVVIPCLTRFEEVDYFIDHSARGEDGFGSTGE